MKPLLLLHGAVGSAKQMEPLAAYLSHHYKIYTFDLTGHGGKPLGWDAFSIRLFADDVLNFLEKEQIDKVSIFGYSMGGYVAMYLATIRPEKIEKVVTLGTKYHWDENVAAKEIQMLDADKIEQNVPTFANTLKQLHAPNDWKQVLQKTTEMMVGLGEDNTLKPEHHKGITVPVLILLGDRDKMVTLDETVAVYRAVPGAQLGVLPGTPHPIEQVPLDLLSFMIKRFLD